MSNAADQSSYRKKMYILLGSLFLFRSVFTLFLDAASDEAYYWVWSRHLALSYFDHPPLVSYFIFLSRLIFGDSVFALRLPMFITVTIAGWAVFTTASRLFSPRVGWYSLLILQLSPLNLVGGFLITPDTPLLLFWALALLAASALFTQETGARWLYVGLFLGAGLLGKYTMILFVPGVLFFLILQRGLKATLLNPRPYLALLLAFILFLPVIVWNYQHAWISFAHQFSHGLAQKKNFTVSHFFEYLGGQMVLFNPYLFVVLLGAIVSSLKRNRSNASRFLACITVVPLVFFAFSSFRAPVEANWPAMAYLSGAILVVAWFEDDKKDHPKRRRTNKALMYSLGFNVLISLLVLVQAAFSPVTLAHDRTDELYGWDELGLKVHSLYKRYSAQGKLFIVANSYQTACQLSFHLPEHTRVYEDPTRGRANVLTVVDTFEDKKAWDCLYISSAKDDMKTRLSKNFSHVIVLEQGFPVHRKGKVIRAYNIYLAKNFDGSWKADLRVFRQKLLTPRYFGLPCFPTSTTAQ